LFGSLALVGALANSRRAGSRDPHHYDHSDPDVRATEREGIERIMAGQR
jgi:hypothetical protein